MTVVDAHVHVGSSQFPTVERFIDDMATFGINAAILVESLSYSNVEYLQECVSRYPDRFAAVGVADAAHRSPESLFAPAHPVGLSGLRFAPRMAWDPAYDVIWSNLDDRHLLASITGPFSDLISGAFARRVKANAGTVFRLEHMGWLRLRDESPTRREFRRFLALADHPNTRIMWSGFWLASAVGHPYNDLIPYLDDCLHAFGAARIMWSGDWTGPEVRRADYGRDLSFINEYLGKVTQRERDSIMGGSAIEAVGLSVRAVAGPVDKG